MKSQEYPSIILVLMVLLGMEGLYLEPELTRNVQYALSGLYFLWYYLKRSWVRKDGVDELPGLVERWVVLTAFNTLKHAFNSLEHVRTYMNK